MFQQVHSQLANLETLSDYIYLQDKRVLFIFET